MSNSEERHDLQTYLNTFKKENEQTDENSMSSVSEAWKAFNEADAVAQKMLQEDEEENLSSELCIHEESLVTPLCQSTPLISNAVTTNKTKMDDSKAQKLEIYDFNETMEDTVCKNDVEKIDSYDTVHVVREENSSIFKCTQCSYNTNKKFLLSRHEKIHSDDRPFNCAVCDRGFKSNAALLNHVNSHLGKKPHQCKFCEMRFNTGGELVRHVRYKHTFEKPHKCGECDYSSVELSKMRRHMRCHTGERPYQCPHCTYASPDNFKLKRHLRTHTGEKPYECDICLARFTQSNSLKSHKLIHSVGDRPVFQCTLCPTTCGRKTDLQLHIQKLHHSEHPIKCKRCGKELPDRYTYKIHVKTHEGEKCFRCKICPYASVSQRHLDMHMLLHTDEKPFVCEHCNTSFRQRQLLTRHINAYHNENYVPPAPQEKNHICPHCRRAFSRKGNLMRHMELHDTLSIKEQEKIKLKIGRMMRLQSDGSIMIPAKEINLGNNLEDIELISPNVSIDKADVKFNEIEVEEEECKMFETFEIFDDMVDEADEDINGDNSTVFHYQRNNNIPKKQPIIKATITSSITISSFDSKNTKTNTATTTKQQHNNIFILPSDAGESEVKTVAKQQYIVQSEHESPTKVEIGSQDTENDDDDDSEDFVVIEVIEEEEEFGDESVSGESNKMATSNELEIPLQSDVKQDLKAFGFVEEEEYVLPVVVINED